MLDKDEVKNSIISVARQIFSRSDPQEKLKVYVLVRMRTFKKLANYYAAIKSEYLIHLDFVENVRKKYDLEEITMVENILKAGVKNNEFNIDNTGLAAVAIVTAMKGLEIPLFWEDDKEQDMEKRLDDLINILFYGLVKR